MIQKLKLLHTILGAEGFILTGSTALAYHGLLTFEEAKDLDILFVNPNPTTIEVLERLQKEAPSLKYKPDGPVNYSFMFEGFKVDVWILTSHEDKKHIITDDGIQIASIRSIVNAKKSIGRSKDWIHLMQLARKIFDQQDFQNHLPTISNHSEGYD